MREAVPDERTSSGAHGALTELEAEILAFEARHPRHSPFKEERIRRRFDRSAAQYYQILGTLVDAPAALAYDPVLIARLRRLRDARADRREVRRSQRRASAVPRLDKAR